MYSVNEQLKDYRIASTICIACRNIVFSKGLFIHVPQATEGSTAILCHSVDILEHNKGLHIL